MKPRFNRSRRNAQTGGDFIHLEIGPEPEYEENSRVRVDGCERPPKLVGVEEPYERVRGRGR